MSKQQTEKFKSHDLLERMAGAGVWFQYQDASSGFAIDCEDGLDLSGMRRKVLQEASRKMRLVFPFLNCMICHACDDTSLEMHESEGDPICFDCFINGREIPQFVLESIRY